MRSLTFLLYLLSWTHWLQMAHAGGGEVESCAVQSLASTNHSSTTETLICQIRTLHSALNLLTLTPSSSSPETILKLKLICNDVLFFESTLSSPQLTPFRNLQELQIINCKLKRIENLGNVPLLRKLIITTGNSDWPQRTLRLNPTALQNSTSNLEILELGFNNILSLPPGFLCQLPNLHTLNLTHNLLSNINDLGLRFCSTAPQFSPEVSNIYAPEEFKIRVAPEVSKIRGPEVSKFQDPPEESKLGSPEVSKFLAPEVSKFEVRPEESNFGSPEASKFRAPEDLKFGVPPEDSKFRAPEVSKIGSPEVFKFGAPEELKSIGAPEVSGPEVSKKRSPEVFKTGAPEELKRIEGPEVSGPEVSKLGLKSLDLSFNSLETLDKLEYFPSLEQLRLDHNRLRELQETLNLSQLRLLNLSSNHLISLAAHLLSASPHLRELHLRNNSLTALPPGIFLQLQHLRILDLSQNQLQGSFISYGIFSKLYRLLHLNLSQNLLTHLGPSTFSDLFTLQSLDLSHNLISSLVDSPFQALSTLVSLNLAHNRLTAIGPFTFKGLLSLQKISLDYNEISEFDKFAFGNSSEIQDLSVVRNQLPKIPEAISVLRKLRTLDLGENQISGLESYSLVGLEQLYGLRLAGNLIPEVPKGFCSHTPKLRALNLASNLVELILAPSFGACPELRVLRLDSNKLEVFEPALHLELPNLLWLNLSSNALRALEYSNLPRHLEWLDVSGNFLLNFKDDSRRSTLPRLRVLDLSFNNLTELDGQSVPLGLEVIKVGFNKISKVAGDTFGGVARLRRVELQGNHLKKLELKALRLPLVAPEGLNSKSPLVEFFLAGNPFLCDCDMEWLTRVNQLSSFRSMTVVDMDEIQCELSFSRSAEFEKRALGAMSAQDFLCGYTSHCFALCHCCEFDYCDCQMTCPEGCECFHDDTWSANVVNCAGRSVSAVPSALPMDSTQVYLDGNGIKELKSHGFIGRKNLRALYLNSSAIEKISNKSFNGLHSLQVLHLEENKLTELVGFEFEGLTRLKELYLQRNFIQSISNDTFLNLKSLEVLNLAGNFLFTFKVWQLSLNRNLGEVSLAGNQFECGNCEFLGLLHKWTRENARKIQDLEDMRCVWNNTKKPGPLIKDYNSTCTRGGVFQFFDLQISTTSFWYLLGGAGVLFVISVTILLLVYAERIKFCLLKHLNLRAHSAPGAKSSHDATFVFSRNDTEFVRRLADTLQAKGYSILLAPDPNRALELRENSTIVTVLSKNFLQDFNTEPEFRQVIFNVLLWTNYQCDNNNSNSVIIVKDRIPKEKTREFFKSFESQRRKQLEKRTVVFESKPRFWEKLTFHLGEPSHPLFNPTHTQNYPTLPQYSPTHPQYSPTHPQYSPTHPNYDPSHPLNDPTHPHHPPPNFFHSHQTSDTGYGTSPSSSLVYKNNFHSALESSENFSPGNNSKIIVPEKIQWPYCKQIPQPPPHFQEMLRNSQFSLNCPTQDRHYNNNTNSSSSGRLSRNTNSECSQSNASPPSNATDTTTVDLETREDEPSVSEYYSHYYHEPVLCEERGNIPASNSTNTKGCSSGGVDDHYYFSLEPSPTKDANILPPQHDFRFTNPNARLQMQTFMV